MPWPMWAQVIEKKADAIESLMNVRSTDNQTAALLLLVRTILYVSQGAK